MSWVSLTVDVVEAESDFIQSLMYDAGASGLELREAGQLIMPNVRPPAAGESIVVGYFENQQSADEAWADIQERVPQCRGHIDAVVERDWSIEWRQQIKSVSVGRLWVGPPWEKPNAPKDKTCLYIEPKMAFGTGDHPTTFLCLKAVDLFMRDHVGASVLDVGTGTGVLAFAAKKLGAGRTVGTDNDPVAIELAKECAQENGIEEVELSTMNLPEVQGRFDFVLANILANTLVELAPLIAPKVGQKLVLAGVLTHQANEVKAAFVQQGLKHVEDEISGEWIRIDFER
jgi:ribosomal protein L11 methyltransferase